MPRLNPVRPRRSVARRACRSPLAWLSALLLLLAACAPLDRAAPVPTATVTGAQPVAATQVLFAQPRSWAGGGPVRSEQIEGLDLQLLGVDQATPQQMMVHLALYNNSEQFLRFDEQSLLDGARLQGAAAQASPDTIEVERGNVEALPPRTGIVAHLRFTPPDDGPRYELSLPTFLAQPIDLGAAPLPDPPTTPPLPEGLWRPDGPLVPSFELPDVGLQIVSFRVRGQEMVVTIALVNLQDQTLTGGTSTISGDDARLVGGRGVAYAPTQVEDALAESILPPGEWYPGERHTGELRFPRPATGPVRFELPTFPPLVLSPARPTLVALATPDHFPPTAGEPVSLPTPPPLPNEALATPVSYDEVGQFLEEVAAAMAGDSLEALRSLFADEAARQVEAWWPGLQSLPLIDPRFDLQRAGIARGTHVSDAHYLLFYRLAGDAPANRFMLPVTLDFQRDGDRWQITRWESDVPLWAEPWEQSESPHFLILADPSLSQETDLLRAEAETAFQTITARLPSLDARERYVMVVPASQRRFEQLTERSENTQGLASFRNLITRDGVETNSLSFVLNGASLADRPLGERQRTIAHELVHLLLAPVTRPYTPAWVSEGAATYFSEDVPWETLRPWLGQRGAEQATLVDLTAVSQLNEGTGAPRVPVQYAYAAGVVAYLVERSGQAAFLDFYRAFATASDDETFRDATRTDDEATLRDLRLTLTRELLQQHYDLTLEQLEADAEGWMLERAAQLP